MSLVNPYTVHATLTADIFALSGVRAMEGCLDAGMPRNRLRITGSPAWDGYARAREIREKWLGGLRSSYSLNKGPIVVFATTWFGGLTARNSFNELLVIYKGFVRTIKRIKQSRKEWNCVIKDRPGGGYDNINRSMLIKLAANEGLGADDYIYVNDNASMAWVACSDAIVAVDSNILVEAMHVGVPAINVQNMAGLIMGPSFDSESGILEATPDNLYEILEEVIEDSCYRRYLAKRMKKSVYRYNAGADGSSANKVVKLIEEMVGKVSKNHVSRWSGAEGGQSLTFCPVPVPLGASLKREFTYPDVPRVDVIRMLSFPPKRVIDIGCGTGSTAEYLKLIYPDVWTCGIEISERAANRARNRMNLVIVGDVP
jgi:hypothetical protein